MVKLELRDFNEPKEAATTMSKDTKPLGKVVQIDEARIEDHLVTVGIAITSYPPHRTGRALLTHTATTLGIWRKSVAQDKGEQFQVSVSNVE